MLRGDSSAILTLEGQLQLERTKTDQEIYNSETSPYIPRSNHQSSLLRENGLKLLEHAFDFTMVEKLKKPIMIQRKTR
jgi:hypothetical protein